MMIGDDAVRAQVLEVLRGGNAYMTFDEAVANYPLERINSIIPNGTYSPWHLLEHIRLAQEDILEFMRDAGYRERRWPEDYWPAPGTLATPEQWRQTIDRFRADRATLEKMVRDPAVDLAQRIPWGTGQTMLREFLLVADHNAYHLGEFGLLRQVMGTWPEGHV
jgi:hypothetical protein